MAKKLVKFQLEEIINGEPVVLSHKESQASIRRWLKEETAKLTDDDLRQILTAFYDPNVTKTEWEPAIIHFLLDAAIEYKIKQSVGKEIHIKNKVYVFTEES